jgi:hypothetical protein
LQPHRSRYWLNADPEDPEVFGQQVAAVCDLYAQAGRLAERGIHLVSTDEKTGIQALERRYPDIPPGPGRVQLREYEYTRHGTTCLIANLEIWCGWIIAPTLGPTRTEADFVAHIEQTVATDPDAGWVFIVDNLNTHQSESLVLWVAQICGLEEDLGEKGKCGGVEVAEEPGGLPVRSGSSHPVRVHAQAHLMAQSDRDLVRHPGEEVAPPFQLPLGRGPQGADPGVHRVLQPDDGRTDPLALLGGAEALERNRLEITASLY